jgi:hypothetical protein
VAVTLAAFPGTSLGGPTGTNLPIAALNSGTIRVVPEPSGLELTAAGAGLLAASWRRRKGRL